MPRNPCDEPENGLDFDHEIVFFKSGSVFLSLIRKRYILNDCACEQATAGELIGRLEGTHGVWHWTFSNCAPLFQPEAV